MLEMFQQLLTRLAMTPGSLKPKQAPPALQTRLLSALQQPMSCLNRPGSILEVWLFRDGQLVRRETYDPIANRFLLRQEVSHHDVLVAVRDFMRDSFKGDENWVAYTVGDFQVVGVLEGRYTLAAITRAGVDAYTIKSWLQRLLYFVARAG